jgi:hypothetical protein
VDRHNKGNKHHVFTDGQGVPLASRIMGANRHDSTQLRPLALSVPPVRGRRGHPRHRYKALLRDHAYGGEPRRRWLHTPRFGSGQSMLGGQSHDLAAAPDAHAP